MRDYDRGRSYGSVLGRIFVFLAIITGVPVMMWTISAFMRTYVAQPVIQGARPLGTAMSASPLGASADMATAAPAASNPGFADARVAPTYGDNSNTSVAPAALANAAVAALTRTAAPAAGATPSSGPPASLSTDSMSVNSMPVNSAPAQIPPAPPSPAYDAAPAPAPEFTSTLGAQPAPETRASYDTPMEELLPPPHPLRGPVPLPPRRPGNLALADSAIPLPRARPSLAPAPSLAPVEAPAPSYEPGMNHY